MRMDLRFLTQIAFIAVFIMSTSLHSANTYYDTHKNLIAEVDRKIDSNIRKQQINQQEQNEINAWTQQASSWIAEQERLNRLIINAKQRSGDYSTLNSQQLNSEIENLTRQLSSVIKPPGGKVIGNKRYSHLQEIYSDMIAKSEALEDLQQKEHDLQQSVLVLDTKREELVRQAKQNAQEFIRENNKLLAHMKNARNRRIEQVNSPHIWCEQQFTLKHGVLGEGPVVCRDRKMALIHLAHRYRAEMIRTGKPYSEEEMKKKIREVEKESSETKKFIKTKLIPVLNEAIDETEKLNRDVPEVTLVDPTGCWFMWLPNNNKKATLHIKHQGNSSYLGKVIDYGWLDLPNGHVLFNVERLNANTFEGTEYSVFNNQKTRTPLRLIVNKMRNHITYRTQHDMVTMSPCN